MNSVTQSPQERSQTKEIFCFSIIIQSSAVDESGVPEDTQTLTAYFREFPFSQEIEQWAAPWAELGYQVVDSWRNLHQKFDENKKVLVDIWSLPMEM
ncbi:MAG: hypothetical protein ACRC2V_09905, partial [Xenococcaceae cyanobacterium]